MYLLYPIEIDDANDTLVFYEDGDVTVSLTSGVYWAYRNEFNSGLDWLSLYDHIETQINAACAGTYHVEATTPDLSNQFVYSGIKLVRDSGVATNWGLNVNGSWTVDPRIFGFNDGAGQQSTTGSELSGDYSRFGVWQQPQWGAWQRIGGYGTKEQFRSSGRRGNGVNTRWGTDEVRTIEFRHVMAGHIDPFVNADSEYAEVAGLATDDHGNAWHDVWDLGLSTYQDLLVIYPDSGRYVSDLELDASGRQWEAIYTNREGADQADNGSSSRSMRGSNAKSYDIAIEVGRVPYSDSSVSTASYYRRGL